MFRQKFASFFYTLSQVTSILIFICWDPIPLLYTIHHYWFILIWKELLIFAENIHPVKESDIKMRNHGTYKSVTTVVCSNLSQIGDSSLVFQILEKVTVGQIVSLLNSFNLNLYLFCSLLNWWLPKASYLNKEIIFEPFSFLLWLSVDWFFWNFLDVFVFQLMKPPLDNACTMLRMLAELDSKPTRLSEQSIVTLCNFISGYLIVVVHVSILSCLVSSFDYFLNNFY